MSLGKLRMVHGLCALGEAFAMGTCQSECMMSVWDWWWSGFFSICALLNVVDLSSAWSQAIDWG